MPYIDQSERPPFDAWLKEMPRLEGPGQLAYALTKVWLQATGYFARWGGFFARALIFGATVLALLEFFRRDVTNYEASRIAANGDVEGFV